MSDCFKVEIKACAVKQLNLLAKLLAHSLTNERIELFGVGDLAVDAVDLLASAVGVVKGKN